MIKRLGFACKISQYDLKDEIVSIPEYNFKSTTVSWLNRQTKDDAVEKLWELMRHNLQAAKDAVKYIGRLDPSLRMFRLGSDLLPVYTHKDWAWFWKQPDVVNYCQQKLAEVGKLAREYDVRLSFHPGQFVVLASESADIVNKSIEEFEYHADMARWMGFGQQFQDFKINVHISGRAGPAGIRAALKRLTPEARNCITIENDEITWGIDSSLELAKDCALVLDIHHDNIFSGKYIQRDDSRINMIIDSWRGVRPVIHYSMSKENYLIDHSPDILPSYPDLIESGYKRNKLRAHSNFMWNSATNKWAYTHWDWADVMVECKSKNLGAHRLFNEWKALAE